MQKLLVFLLSGLLLSSFLSSGYTSPDTFKGPGGCTDKASCYEYCKQHPEACKDFRTTVQPFADKTMMAYPVEGKPKMQEGQGMMFFSEMDATEMAMGGLFMQAKDMDPMHFKQYCPDAQSMVDAAIAKLKEQGIELKAHCDQAQKMLQLCKEHQGKCENFKTNPFLDKKLLRCGRSQEEFFKECMEGVQGVAPGKNVEMQCEQQFQPLKEKCERQSNTLCDESSFIQHCMSQQEERCRSLPPEQHEGCIQGNNCRGLWETKRQFCEQQQSCDREIFMRECKERLSKGYETAKGNQEERCKQQAAQLWEHAQQNCKVGEDMYARCVDEREQQCSRMEIIAKECSSITPEQMRSRMIERARKMCAMMDKYKEERGGMEEAMMHMMSMRDKMPADKRMFIEKEMEKIDTINTDVDSQGKGETIFKKFFRLLGFFKEKEEREVEQLKNNAQKLEESIKSLTTLSEQIHDQSVKESLVQQIAKLNEEQAKIIAMAEGKKKGVEESLSGMFVKIFSR